MLTDCNLVLLFAHSINTLADDKRIDMNEKNIREKFGAVLLLGISAAVAATELQEQTGALRPPFIVLIHFIA